MAVHHYSDSCISLSGLGYEFSGGMHGNQWVDSLTLLLLRGRAVKVELPSLLVDEAAGEKLCRMVWRELVHQNAAWTQGGECDISVGDLDDFVISPAGICFASIRSQVQGVVLVRLSWDQLRGVLSPPAELVR